MDIMLVHPGDGLEVTSEHLGIASLKAFIIQGGFTADTLDLALENLSVKTATRRLLAIRPAVLGISMLDQTKARGIALIKELKQSGFHGPVIVGGYFPTFHAGAILENIPDIDFIVRGEGEHTLLDLMYYFSGPKSKTLHQIAGISYRINGQVIHNFPRPLIDDLDCLPMVDRKYAVKVLEKTGHLRVYASRGCWGGCSFCDINAFYTASPGSKWRSRSIQNFVDELEHLCHTFACDYFILNDDNFLTRGLHNRERADSLAAELARRNLSLKFELMGRVDSIDRQVMYQLKKSGLQRIFLGIESFDQDQLNRFRKGTTVRQNLKAIILLKQLKIDCIISVILADAYTGLRTLIKQFFILFLIKQRYINSRNCKISINEKLELYRGSLLYQHYKNAGLLTRDHWLNGYEYQLKILTSLRLKLARMERKLYHHISGWIKMFIKAIRVHSLSVGHENLKTCPENILKN